MLDKNALSQLQGLKNKIDAEKEYAEGTVKATRSRFGFVVLDDTREIFLPPDEMQRVLPGDRVSIVIKPAAAKDKSGKAQSIAELEKLRSTAVDNFVGEVVQKGKAFFVAPDVPDLMHFTRWLFIPPNARSRAKAGDLVHCRLQRHPFADGKPSVQVLQSFGPIGTPGLENDYCVARAGLEKMLPRDQFKAIEALVDHGTTVDETREDLRALPLVSIDSPNTVDIDDAICAEPQQKGWLLTVAIADPTTHLKEAADLTTLIATRGTSHYFHGLAIPMLPEVLAQSAALRPQEDKNALVCRLTISPDGDITDSSIQLAIVQSKAKLSYQEVEEVFTNGAEHEFAVPLKHLNDCYSALRAWRKSRELVIEHRPEHRWLLNENKQIDRIEEVQKKASQLLVEECMIAANRCMAQALKDAELPGPFVTHAGIRRDRAEEAKEFLTRFLPEQHTVNFSTLDGFRMLINALNAAGDERPLRSMINRLMSRATFSVKPAPHMGMALPVYTNGTSPLRKALDFCVHLQIKAMLGDTSVKTAPATVFDLINQATAKNRQAVTAANSWLSCNFLNAQSADGQSDYDAEIVHINTSGFTVKLKDSGLEGTVDLRREEEKFSFDKWEMALISKTRRYQLRQRIRVRYQPVEKPRGESARFSVIEVL